MIVYSDLERKINLLKLRLDKRRIKMAFDFADAAHEGQKRRSGEPYIIHPLHVAMKVLDFNPDDDMVVAALLHDVSEDTERTLDDIENVFGPAVRNLVNGLEKVAKVRAKENEYQAENLRKMFVSMASDIRVIVVKLCDRWHNMQTLNFVKEEKQRRIALETLMVYVPIASRLGIYRIKSALEDLCFQFLEPESFKDIDDQLDAYGKSRSRYIKSLEALLSQFLKKNHFKVKVESRVKTHYSIHSKMKKKSKESVEEVFDVFALRITVPTKFNKDKSEYTGELYNILGAIHAQWTPLIQRFKDYVAVPKPNGYRSLHTTLVGMRVDNITQPVEVQIRSELMHEEAEYGVASHWAYKENSGPESSWDKIKKLFKETSVEKVKPSVTDWVKILDDFQAETESNEEFIKDLKLDLFNDRIFVLTPNGDIMDLPSGATPIDFAYLVHSDVGNHTYMSKVDGVAVSLDTELKNGQMVDILTKKSAEPNRYWLSFVKTSSARTKIKAYFKSKDADKNVKAGRDILNKYLQRLGKPVLNGNYDLLKKYADKDLTFKAREKLLEDIGAGQILPSAVVRNVFVEKDLLSCDIKDSPKYKKGRKAKLVKTKNKNVLVDGLSNLPIKFAPCCGPKVGDVILGYVTRGDGVTVHKFDCKVLHDADKERVISVEWESPDKDKYQVGLVFEMRDRVGLLHDITKVISDAGVNIIDISSSREDNEGGKIRNCVVEVTSYEQLNRMLDRLERIKNIVSVRKVI